MSSERLPKVWRTVRWPVALSVVVVLVRLAGELAGWDPLFFGTSAGGGFALVGVGWLMPVFGFVFGWILTGRGHAPDRPGLSIILHALGMAVLVVGVILSSKNLDYPIAFAAIGGVALVSLLFAWRGWSELLRYTLVYGLLVRLVVVAITAIAFPAEWGTHFEKVQAELAERPADERFVSLIAPQMLFWIPATVLVGGIFGAIAALVRGRRADDAPDD